MSKMGKVEAALCASSLKQSYPNVMLDLVVGICGGVPFRKSDIVLGDVIIIAVLVQYDYGRRYPSVFLRRDAYDDELSRPNSGIKSFLAKTSGTIGQQRLSRSITTYVERLCNNLGFAESKYLGVEKDKLYQPSYDHRHR